MAHEPASDRGPLPNFLIVGAMRSGTTTLARTLGAHPQVYMASQKEIHFFDRHFQRGVDWYRSRFAGATGQMAVGEATPAYLYDAASPPRMAEVIPDARLICILRNPVDRAYSHYWLERGLGREALSFREAVRAEPKRLASDPSPARINRAYLDCSRYLPQLQRLTAHYPRGSLLVMILEDLEKDPAAAYREACWFLGVDPGFVPRGVTARMNPYREYRSLRLRRAVRTGRRSMVKRVLGRLNVRPETTYPPLDPELRGELLASFGDHNAELARWLGSELPWWNL
jgi:hypothetical protein